MEDRQEVKDWIKRRVEAVFKVYTVFQCLTEHGVELVDPATPLQISCNFHGADQKPSARYYPSTSGRDHFHCFTCKLHLNAIDLFARFEGKDFMEALKELERRNKISVPRVPDAASYAEPLDRGSEYQSEAWADIPRVLNTLESKLIRVRNKVPLSDFVKWCRVMDLILWDFEKSQGKATPEMAKTLSKLRNLMDEAFSADDQL